MKNVDHFKRALEEYDGENIPDDVLQRVGKIIADDEFTKEKMQSKSIAAANLCGWVVNIYKYNGIFKRVKPLMDSKKAAEEEKAAAEASLAKVEAEVAEIDAKLQDLQSTFLKATDEKAKVEAEADYCKSRLQLAERLVGGLSSENKRWGADVERLKESVVTVPGDVLLGESYPTLYCLVYSSQS